MGARSVKSKKIIWLVIIAILLVIIFPFIMDYFIIGNEVPSNISNSEWVSFLGSYVGAIISAMIGIVGVFLTIQYYKEQDEKSKEEKNELILSEIKKQYEIKYKFEFLEELELANRNISKAYESFNTIKILIEHDNKENCLNKISKGVWDYNLELSKSIDLNFINLKSIYKGKLDIFYKSDFFDNIEDDIEALTTMFAYALDRTAKSKTSEEFYENIYEIVMQWRISRKIETINDINSWIEDIKINIEEFMDNFKENI